MTQILVADDEAVIIMQLQELLEEMGHKVAGVAARGDDALRLARDLTPDLVLMDIVMPGDTDGIAACRAIQQELNIPVVLMTAHSGDALMSRAMEADPYGYVTKPFNEDQVRATVEMAVAKKSKEREFEKLIEIYRGQAREKELLHGVMESFPFGLAVIDPEGRVLYLNKEATNITGYSVQDIPGVDDFLRRAFPDPGKRAETRRNWFSSRRTRAPRLQEEKIICAGGEDKIIEFRSVFLQDLTAVISMNDVSATRDAEEALRLSEKKFRTVADFTYDWEFWLKPDMSFEYVSPSCEAITGHSARSFLQDPGLLFRITVPEDREPLRQALEEAMSRGKTKRHDFRVRTASGVQRWLGLAIQPIPAEAGCLCELRGSIRNITWRKQTEEALRMAEEKFRAIFEEAPLGIFRSTPEGRFTEVNPALARMLGYDTPGDVMENITDIAENLYVHPERRAEIVEKVMLSEGVLSFENEYRRADGSTFTANLNVRLVRDDAGRPRNIEGTVEDVSVKKRAEALREDVERMSRHDLKSPLISIIYGLKLLLQGGRLDQEGIKVAEHCESAGYRMLNMINLSLDLYKMETGVYEFQPEHMDLLPVVRRVLSELSSEIEQKELQTDILVMGEPARDDSVFQAMGEELLCYSMLANLIRNAVEASPQGERVTIDLVEKDDSLKISIHNRGLIPDAVRDSFFEKYSTFGKKDGTGLGAYSARLIARTHKGDIKFATSEDEGTTVTVSLPRVLAEAESEQTEQ
jgi:PAS domain S-box-containing protein